MIGHTDQVRWICKLLIKELPDETDCIKFGYVGIIQSYKMWLVREIKRMFEHLNVTYTCSYKRAAETVQVNFVYVSGIHNYKAL